MLWEDFKIVSFDCPNCTNSEWTSIINVQGKFQGALCAVGDLVISGTPTNSSWMEFSCPGLVVKQRGFYIVIPIHPRPQVFVKAKFSDGPLERNTAVTIWFDQGDQINFKTFTQDVDNVPGTTIRVQKL